MVAAAEEEARRIRAEAEASREAIRVEAAEAGRQEGLARAAAVLAAASAERARRLAALDREVVVIAVEVARKVLARELAAGGDAVVGLAARALAEARERREVILRVNPADGAAVHDSKGRLGGLLLRARLLVREDAAVPRGAAVVDTEAGSIDAGIEAQLAQLERALEEALAG